MGGREYNCKWYFSDQPIGFETGPNNAMEQSFKRHPYASLVRESIQNSLDAVLDNSQPVVVKYTFQEMKGMDYPEFFRLKEHIRGCLDYYSENRNAKEIYAPMLNWFGGGKYHENIGYICVSDYNTKGMGYEANSTNNSFYAFVRSAGVSAKESVLAGGSFGFGKAAYFLLSPISTIIVSTCTPDNKHFFEGVASLCTHTYENKKKVAVGYYDSNDGHPVDVEESIPAKFRRTEPGTDINILGFDFRDRNEAVTEMKEAVLRNFWMAILNGRLVVEIDNNVVIDKNSIAELMSDTFSDDDIRGGANESPRPYFDAVYLQGTSRRYCLVEDNIPLLGHVMLYVNKQKGISDKISYMRDLQMLVFSKKNKTNYGMCAVFYCDDEAGNGMLRNMENPAHDEWKAGNWKSAGRTNPNGRQALRVLDEFIGKSLSDIFVKKKDNAVDIKGLEDFLYIPTAYEEDGDSDIQSYVGEPTGEFYEDGHSYTTDIPYDNSDVADNSKGSDKPVGLVVVNKTATASASTSGDLKSGHTDKPRQKTGSGIKVTGDASDPHEEDENGERGIYATKVNINYRSFSQKETGNVYHYIVMHSNCNYNNVRLRFYGVGEDGDAELNVLEVNQGVIVNHCVQDVFVPEGRSRLRIRFSDNMRHAIKITAEDLHEVQ
jgi:hypothetical protein